MHKCKKLLLLYSLYAINGLFMNDFPKFRRIHNSIKKKKIYIIDIDGTICITHNSNYNNSIPKTKNIEIFNNLYENGNEIHYWTARGAKSGIDWNEYTKQQLNEWGVKYTSINLGKPHYDVWIDDKAINEKDIDTDYVGN